MSTGKKFFSVDSLGVQIYNSELQLAQDVAEIAQKHLQYTLRQQDNAAVLLATGNSQIKFLDALIALGGVDWSRITLFHLDEYLGISADHFANLENVPKYAFTVTMPMICSAKKILCLALEKRKAKVVQQMFQGDITTQCPASFLRRQPQATLFLDVDSASLLTAVFN